ncbi:MAG TPA: hypothetical protein V6D48_18670 [Oculatellaceae cyanobacterium]
MRRTSKKKLGAIAPSAPPQAAIASCSIFPQMRSDRLFRVIVVWKNAYTVKAAAPHPHFFDLNT